MIDNEWKAILGWSGQELEEIRLSGFSFLQQGHYSKALLFFKALVILDPLNLYDLQTLGALYLQLGHNEKARSFLEQALRLDNDHLPTRINWVKALFCLEDFPLALEEALLLKKCSDPSIAREAEALILSRELFPKNSCL